MASSAFGDAVFAAFLTNGCFGIKLVPELIEFTILGIGTIFPFSSAYPAFLNPTDVSTSVPFLLNLAIPAAAACTISFSSGDGKRLVFYRVLCLYGRLALHLVVEAHFLIAALGLFHLGPIGNAALCMGVSCLYGGRGDRELQIFIQQRVAQVAMVKHL